MREEDFVKYKGQVKEVKGSFIFVSDCGKEFCLMKNEMNRRVADSHELCVIEVPLLKDGTPAEYGAISSVCGKKDDPFAEGQAIAEVYGLPRVYSQELLDQLDKISMTIPAVEYETRLDLRNENIITIDPKTAGDHDDAFVIKINEDGTITLINAIADLDSTIPVDTPLFKHVEKICNSNYLGVMVYPMTPEKISNDKNSLNEGDDKEAVCTIITFNPDGSIVNYALTKAIINVKKRLSYAEADYLVFGENSKDDKEDHTGLEKTISPEIMESLTMGYEFAQILRDRRLERGSLIISDREVKFEINQTTNEVESYSQSKTEETMGLIEEFALITNLVGCQIAQDLEIPFMYRNHDQLAKEKEVTLALGLKEFGISLPAHPTGKQLQRIIENNRGKRLSKIIESTILKALRHAYYSSENNGHVGTGTVISRYEQIKNSDGTIPSKYDILNNSKSQFSSIFGKNCGVYFEGDIDYSAYAHLTSPIRRFSDLVNQKNQFAVILDGRPIFDKVQIETFAARCNEMEHIAEMAEGDYDRMLMGKWASNNIGQKLRGIVVSFGKSKLTLMTEDNLIFHLPYDNLLDKSLARNLAHPFKGEKRRLKLGTQLDGYIERVSDNRIICTQKEMELNKNVDASVIDAEIANEM